ncbi:MAG: class I SAM-dependent methyltransferase, partial [Spirochaetaceae bacterium]|nr:class I SAM-dependent methyltransferase [Spirochaetaceae bacterium]
MNMDDSIKKTAKGFEESFFQGAYYNSQTQDFAHLTLILNQLSIRPGNKILDLGTGMGYLAFPLAEQNPRCTIKGLDIV